MPLLNAAAANGCFLLLLLLLLWAAALCRWRPTGRRHHPRSPLSQR
jgi:hypothetical protein